ncbi:hypothetical protein TGVEG_266065 [Toxoplasma gondii VEG]|uniref:Secreted protein n=1 Tax=Toxoplasma gondii (strain ATCC 50861 / VEG) TaxID=432359 RepID=V4ZIA0_TOXGV|nr:hypothetical protein TGVEG_266065 [Toxoplasma gondii VEG]
MKLSQVSFVGTLAMLASAKRICEVYATSTRLLEKTNPTRALESEYPPHVRRPQFAETLVGTTSRAGKSLPALLQRPHRLQSITVVARSPTSGSEEEPALLSPQHSTRKGTAPSDLLTETRHADFRHLNAYDNGLADALEVTIAARNERNYRPGSRRRLPTTVPSVSRFAGSKQAATAQAAVSELTLTPSISCGFHCGLFPRLPENLLASGGKKRI